MILLIQFDDQLLCLAGDGFPLCSAESANGVLFHQVIAGMGRAQNRNKHCAEIVFMQAVGDGKAVTIAQLTVPGIILQGTKSAGIVFLCQLFTHGIGKCFLRHEGVDGIDPAYPGDASRYTFTRSFLP